jgi:small conductance mechanosensitive channel
VPRRYPLQGWVIGILCSAITLAALVVGSEFGDVHAKSLNPKLIAWLSAVAIVTFGIIATARVSRALSLLVAKRSVPAAEGAVRFISAAVGYLFVAFATLAVLDVSVERLIVGAGLAGVVLGIAAQQSLGNIFAGLVLILARPFGVGDHIRIRSGSLGGIFDAWVREISLTYVTVQTDDGEYKIPNTAMLAAGVAQVRDEGSSTGQGVWQSGKTGAASVGAAGPGVPGTTTVPTAPAMTAPVATGPVATPSGTAPPGTAPPPDTTPPGTTPPPPAVDENAPESERDAVGGGGPDSERVALPGEQGSSPAS